MKPVASLGCASLSNSQTAQLAPDTSDMSYADDLTLTPPSLGVALASLGVLEEVCDEWGLAINWDKSEMVVFTPGSDPQTTRSPTASPWGGAATSR